MLKFADNTKVICPIEKEESGATLQADLEKSKVMHFGYNNPCLEYTMG